MHHGRHRDDARAARRVCVQNGRFCGSIFRVFRLSVRRERVHVMAYAPASPPHGPPLTIKTTHICVDLLWSRFFKSPSRVLRVGRLAFPLR